MDANHGTHLHDDETKPVRDNTEFPSECRYADRKITIGELAREAGVTLRAVRFYQSKGLLAPQRNGAARVFNCQDRARLTLIQQGKRLGFTLSEIRELLAARVLGCDKALPISRRKCSEQIKFLEHQRRDLELALVELRQIYTGMFITSDIAHTTDEPAAKTA